MHRVMLWFALRRVSDFFFIAYAAVFFSKSVPTLSFRGVPFTTCKSLIFPPARKVSFHSLFLLVTLYCTVVALSFIVYRCYPVGWSVSLVRVVCSK